MIVGRSGAAAPKFSALAIPRSVIQIRPSMPWRASIVATIVCKVSGVRRCSGEHLIAERKSVKCHRASAMQTCLQWGDDRGNSRALLAGLLPPGPQNTCSLQTPIAMNLPVLAHRGVAQIHAPNQSNSSPPENTQGWHYTPKSPLRTG